MNKTTKIILASAIAIALFFTIRQFTVKKSSAVTLDPKTDTIISPKLEEIKDQLTLSGSINADQIAILKFQNSGKLNWVGVKVGDRVKRGQVLATLDSAQLKKSLQSQFNSYRSQLSQFNDTQSTYKKTKEDFLVTETIQRILDRTQYSLENSVINYEIADMAIKESRLVTPIEGVVVAIDQPLSGVNVTPTGANITVINPNSLYFRSEVDQQEVVKLVQGLTAIIKLDSFDQKEIDSKLSFIAFTPVAGQSSTVYEIRFPLPLENQNLNYRLGMDGDVVILIKEKTDILTVPIEAINDDNGQIYVWLKINNKLERRDIKTGIETDSNVEILEGINQNDQVVIKKR
ncbi:MAG: efflux RND transporter periplasmic adaptor subunit [Candidatus Shapirobacteria bacterium]